MSIHSIPAIVAHRGWGKWMFPENSMEAFRYARAQGCQFVECDVWASSDGEPVVIHDETLDRVTMERGEVSARSSEKLAALRLRNARGELTEYQLPSLARAREWVDFVEIKPANAPDLVRRTIEVMSPRTDWVLQSFDEANLLHAQCCLPKPDCLALLVHDPAGVETAVAGRWQTHIDHHMLDAGLMRRLREMNLRVGAWTVNEEADIRRMIELGVDVLITDEPGMARSILATRASRP